MKDFDLSLRELFYDMIVAATSVLYLINTSATYRRGHVQFYFIGQQNKAQILYTVKNRKSDKVKRNFKMRQSTK